MASFLLRWAAALGSCSAAATTAPPPPYWGPVWTAPFNQTITIEYIFQFNNSVGWFYDSTTTPVGSSLYVHGEGQHDELSEVVQVVQSF
jgi:hypothetical protein